MTKKKRIMISLDPDMIVFMDRICDAFNAKPDTRPEDVLTRSRFISLCICSFAAEGNALSNEKTENKES